MFAANGKSRRTGRHVRTLFVMLEAGTPAANLPRTSVPTFAERRRAKKRGPVTQPAPLLTSLLLARRLLHSFEHTLRLRIALNFVDEAVLLALIE